MEVRPFLSPHAELAVTHRQRDGQLVPEAFSLRSNRPFESECMLQPWLAQIVAHCDGKTSWREHFERAKSAGAIPGFDAGGRVPGGSGALVSNGLLWIAEMPLPGLVSHDTDGPATVAPHGAETRSDAEFAALRGMLAQCGFTQERIFARLALREPANTSRSGWAAATCPRQRMRWMR